MSTSCVTGDNLGSCAVQKMLLETGFPKRWAKWTPRYAAIVPNFHLPMCSYKVKNRTSTDDIKSLRLITAIKTPYLPDGRFDLEAYDSLVNMQIEDGADGVIVGGATGEGQLMSWDEHIMLIGHTINCFGTAIKVIGNTGSNSTREEVHATEQGFAVGMHAAVHHNPFNGKTPYLPDRRFDLESYASAYASLVNIEAGADGVIVGGTTSEGQLMSWDEHSMLIGHTINCFGTSRKVIGNTLSNSTREAVHATEQKFAVGMHAAVHINPFNCKTTYLPDWRFDLEAYASLVNIEDGADGVIVADSTNFAGVKECVGHDRVKENTKEGIIVWSGNDDECHVSRWDHDATGVISVASNLVPGLMHELLSKGKNPSLNEKPLPLISWLFCEPNPIG